MVQAFTARAEALGGVLLLRLPEEASLSLPSRGMVMGEGFVNDAPFVAPLEPDGLGGHWLEISPLLAEYGGIRAGTPVSVRLEPARVWPDPDLPEDLAQTLAKEGLMERWSACTVKARWEWLRWARATSSPVTRGKRLAVMADKLKRGEKRPCCYNAAACSDMRVCKGGALPAPGA